MVGYVMLTLGGLLFGAMVYRYDMHEREPWWMLVCAAIAGAGMMSLAYLVQGLIEPIALRAESDLVPLITMSLTAGTIEELAKLAVPVAVLLLIRKHFNDPMDGLVYGSLAGLGAAFFESLWYTVLDQQADDSPLQQMQKQAPNALRLLLHTVWGGISGFALGLIVMKKPWRKPLAKYLGIVMLIHFAWDAFLGYLPQDQYHNGHRLLAAGLLAASIVWYGVLVVRANKWSRSMHAPTSKQRLIGKIVRAVVFRKFR